MDAPAGFLTAVRGQSGDSLRSSLVRELVPRFLRKPAEEFAGTKGTALYESFVTGKREYLCFVLQRRCAESGDATRIAGGRA